MSSLTEFGTLGRNLDEAEEEGDDQRSTRQGNADREQKPQVSPIRQHRAPPISFVNSVAFAGATIAWGLGANKRGGRKQSSAAEHRATSGSRAMSRQRTRLKRVLTL